MPNGQKSLEFVAVGDPGNAGDVNYYGDGGKGAVSYTYQIGKYDVTTSQYCQFLKAVAATDTYGLYSVNMTNPTTSTRGVGCGITRSGVSGHYTYAVMPGHENYPVTRVTWGNAVRFANWLANGQPSGSQGPGTTETGSYTLSGWTDGNDLVTVTRNPGASYVLPTEDEWYKAAYYKGGSTDAKYWLRTRYCSSEWNSSDPLAPGACLRPLSPQAKLASLRINKGEAPAALLR